MENVALHDFEVSFKWALVIFYFIGTLNSRIYAANHVDSPGNYSFPA